jgi:uncharacterized protein YjbI with pentapeptide repeats
MQENPLLAALSGSRYLRDVNASGTSLVKADLKNLRADQIYLCSADLAGASLEGAHLVDCDFGAANLTGTDFSKSVMRLCVFDNAHAVEARFEEARLEDSSLQGADFSRARMRGARITESSWARACLRSADLSEAQGDGVEFRGADLTEASLKGVRLIDADFRGADLTRATLAGGDFRGSDFRGAILDDAEWEGASFVGAMFDEDASIFRTSSAEETTPESSGLHSESAGKDEAAATAVTEFVLQFLTSANANSDRTQNLAKVKESLEAWRSQTGEIQIEDIAELFETIEKSLGDAGTWPPEAMNSFSGVLRSLEHADDLEPPPEWKELLMKLFPTLAQDKDENALEEMASNLQTFFNQPPHKNDRYKI